MATGIGIAGILAAYMASLWAEVDDTYPQAAILTRVTIAVAVSGRIMSVFIPEL